VLALQPASWPRVWSTDDAIDLKSRLQQLPLMRRGTLSDGCAPRAQLGSVFDDIQTLLAKAPNLISQAVTIVQKAEPYIPTITSAVQDPAMPQLMARVQTLQALEAAKSPPKAPGAPAAPASVGVGLSRVLPLFDVAIWYEKHPWAPWAIGAGVIAVLGGVGFGVGRWTKRCRSSSTAGYRRRR